MCILCVHDCCSVTLLSKRSSLSVGDMGRMEKGDGDARLTMNNRGDANAIWWQNRGRDYFVASHSIP